jgi:hypothetical protein
LSILSLNRFCAFIESCTTTQRLPVRQCRAGPKV